LYHVAVKCLANILEELADSTFTVKVSKDRKSTILLPTYFDFHCYMVWKPHNSININSKSLWNIKSFFYIICTVHSVISLSQTNQCTRIINKVYL
jgi:hypothetical protein